MPKVKGSEISPDEAAEVTQEVSFGELKKNLMSCFDATSSSDISFSDNNGEFMNVFLRIRPFSAEELKRNEKQDNFQQLTENSISLVLNNPPSTTTQKTSSTEAKSHQFTFTRIFDASTSQVKIFRSTILKPITAFLDGQSWLIFTYGVTNSGKTFTIQGTPNNPGILPRAIDVVFNSIGEHTFQKIFVKPVNYCDVKILNKKEIKEEYQRKDITFGNLIEKDSDFTSSSCDSSSSSKLTASLFSEDSSKDNFSILKDSLDKTAFDFLSRMKDDTVAPVTFTEETKISIWISFYEIYNEYIYDLLEPLTSKQKRRSSLKLAEDKSGNIYIKGLKEVCVFSAEEALKLLIIGQRNLRYADTKLNHNSSRSHCIYTIKMIQCPDGDDFSVYYISRLSFCDLAGSERSSKTLHATERIKEAGNINSSLMSLGRCIDAIRHNQTNRDKKIIPFRDSKLCRVFQSYLCGKGKVSMIVNINQCASMLQETLHSLNFSAIATQVSVIAKEPPKPTKLSLMLQNIERRKTLSWCPERCTSSSIGSALSTIDDDSESDDDYDDEECHCQYHSCESNLELIKTLKEELTKERREKLNLEYEVRQEVVEEMSKFIPNIDTYSEEIAKVEKEAYSYAERQIALYKEYVKNTRRESLSFIDDDDDDKGNITIKEVNEKDEQDDVEWKQEKQLMEKEILELKETIKKLEKRKSPMKSSNLSHENVPANEDAKANMKNDSAVEEIKKRLCEAKTLIQKQEAEIKDLNLTLDEAGATFLSTEKQIQDYKATIESQDHTISVLTETVEKLQGELGERHFLLEDRESRINDLEEEMKTLTAQFELSLQQKDMINNELMEEIKKLKEEGCKKANIEEELEAVKFEALAQTSQMAIDLKNHEGKMQEQKETIQKLTEQLNEMQVCFEKISTEVQSKTSELNLANKEIACLTRKVNNKEREIINMKNTSEENQRLLQEENSQLFEKIEKLQISLKDLEGDTKEMQKLKETLMTKDAEITRLHSEIENTETELKRSRYQFETAKEEGEKIKVISEKMQDLERKLEVAEFNLQCALYAARELLEMDNVKNLPEGMELINILKNCWSAKLKSESENQGRLIKMQQEIEDLRKNEERLEVEFSSVMEKLNKQEKEKAVLRKEECEQEDLNDIKSQLKINATEIEKLKKYIEDQELTIALRESMITEREKTLSSCKKELQEYQHEIKQLKEILEENNSELKISEKEVIELKDEIRRLNTENSVLIQEAIKEERENLIKREQELEEKIKSQKKEIRLKDKELEKLKLNVAEDGKQSEVVSLVENENLIGQELGTGAKPKRAKSKTLSKKSILVEDNYDSHEDFEKENKTKVRTRRSARRTEKSNQDDTLESINIPRRTRRAKKESNAENSRSNIPVKSSSRKRPLYKPETSMPLELSPVEVSTTEDQLSTSAYSVALRKLRERREHY